ncbi:MAG: glycoside hydrolase family 18 protein [Bacilli bacterium]|nr:glycoside hydrolase family 18 protein [Bacilli bacterium]
MKKIIIIFAGLLFLLSGCVNKEIDINDEIEALPNVEEVVISDGEAIVAIREKIDAMSDEEFLIVTTVSLERFLAIEARFHELIQEFAKVQEVRDIEAMFDLLPLIENLSVNDYETLENIKGAYNALDETQKALFDPEKKLLLDDYDDKMTSILVPDHILVEVYAVQSAMDYIDSMVPTEVTESITLPFEYIANAACFQITWRSHSNLITDEGEITRPDYDNTVTLTATLTGFFIVETYTIEIKIKGTLIVNLPILDGSKKLTFAYLRDVGYGDNLVNRDYMKIDVINYSFGKIVNGELSVRSLENLQNVLRLRAKGVRIVIVIDGVSTNTREAFVQAASSEENREKLATSIANVIEQYQFDGVDLDWEFPNGTTEKNNFSLLVKRIREKLDESDRDLILSAAVRSGGYSTHYNLVELNKYLDYLHIMSYGMSGSNTARHQSALMNSTYSSFSISSSVNMYINGGMDRDKVVFGIPFYVKVGTLANPTLPALGQSLSNYYSVGYSSFMATTFVQQNFVEYFDAAAQVYYAVGTTQFASYDNPESIRLKCEWAIENGIAGVMFWDYGHDQAGGTLLQAIYETFNPIE